MRCFPRYWGPCSSLCVYSGGRRRSDAVAGARRGQVLGARARRVPRALALRERRMERRASLAPRRTPRRTARRLSKRTKRRDRKAELWSFKLTFASDAQPPRPSSARHDSTGTALARARTRHGVGGQPRSAHTLLA